ncbi:MAG TPA: glycosyltransferase family 2 protein [bacterium]|nr:glycosyltransferase family 2 protein [bacterium]
MFAVVLFWITVFLIFYTYCGYFLLLLIWHRLARRKSLTERSDLPTVTMVISAHNEQAVIRKKIENCRSIDYPRGRIEFLFGTDGCTDGTDRVLQQNDDLRVIAFSERSGKAGVLNRLVPQATGEILCFSDANTIYEPDAIRKLVRHLSDERIGGVCGNLLLTDRENPAAKEGEARYWHYENRIKKLEGDIRTVFGASGGIYVIRRELYQPLPADRMINDDFLLSMRVVQQGYDVIYDGKAVAYETPSSDVKGEFRRKVRIGAANFAVLPQIADLLHPNKGFIAFGLWSHKIVRWLVPFLLLIALIASACALDRPFFQWIFAAQLLFYGTALVGCLAEKRFSLPVFVLYPYYFTAVNLALAVGFFRFLFRLQKPTWQSIERN